MIVGRTGWLRIGLLFVMAAAGPLHAQEAGEVVVRRGTIEDDVYAAGRRVEVAAQAQGDVVAAGQFVSIDETVAGDVLAAGETVTVRAKVQDDVRVAGRSVSLAGQVAGHVVAAGDVVDIAPAAVIDGWAWLAGREVSVAGRVGRSLGVAGQSVILSGEVHGDVEILAEDIRILESARIDGNLVYRSNREPDIAAGARIAGDTIARPMPYEEPEGRGAGVFLFLALLVAAIVYYLLFPVFSLASAGTLRRTPLAAAGVGLAVLFAMPLAVLLLFATVIGVLVAIALLAAWLVSLLPGFLGGVILAGDSGLRLAGRGETAGRGMRVLSMAAALGVILLLQLVPVLGAVTVFVLLVTGTGALYLQAWRVYSGTS